jgi:hypothetical protein
VDSIWRTAVWPQFEAAIDMLENAMVACRDEVWSDRSRQPEFWYLVYHTLFFLDYYLSDPAGFAPPAPFTLSELDPAGILPERVYAKHELHAYLEHGRGKCRAVLHALTEARAREPSGFDRLGLSVGELHVYALRHVQHHAAQLYLVLRQRTDFAPRWVVRGRGAQREA